MSRRILSVLLGSMLLLAGACDDKGGRATTTPDPAGAALPPKDEGEELDRVRAAVRYRRAAEQRGKLVWDEGEGGKRLALVGMYLAGAEDLGELSLVRAGPRRVEASISILARGPGAAGKCKATLAAGDSELSVRSRLERGVTPPEGLRVDMDRLAFDLDLDQLGQLAATADSGGSACGMAFTFTRAQRDRLDRAATLFASPDDASVSAAQARWDDDRLPAEDGGFRPLDPST